MTSNRASSNCSETFWDRHIHGFAGVDFSTGNTADITAAVQLLAARRTTQVTVSIPTVRVETLDALLGTLHPVVAAGTIAGVHLEGPFLSPSFAGAHPVEALLSPTSPSGQALLDVVERHQAARRLVTMMTVAPELDGFQQLIQRLVKHNIAPALGHTAASYAQMRAGIDTVTAATNSPVVITHIYNAMRGFHHRDPGPLLAILDGVDRQEVLVELIADGQHVDMALIRWWFDHYPQAIRLVSDASAATLPAGVTAISSGQPTLGHVPLDYPSATGPRLADGTTLASGGLDLLGVHDVLIAHGVDHELVCGAMRAR